MTEKLCTYLGGEKKAICQHKSYDSIRLIGKYCSHDIFIRIFKLEFYPHLLAIHNLFFFVGSHNPMAYIRNPNKHFVKWYLINICHGVNRLFGIELQPQWLQQRRMRTTKNARQARAKIITEMCVVPYNIALEIVIPLRTDFCKCCNE